MTYDLDGLAKEVGSLEDLAGFVERFAIESGRSPERWRNFPIAMFLKAMSEWISDSIESPNSPGYRPLHERPTWQTFALILLAAGVHELRPSDAKSA
jgi:hypothetical protein